jgi:predicted porin
MRKSLIALAALGAFAGAAQAQTSVTLYGTIDANIEYVNRAATPTGGGGSILRMGSGGFASNRWGIRGVENLGGGLSGVFVIESGYNTDTGTSFNATRTYDRQTYVGLKSDTYGQLTFGRQYTSMFLMLGNYSPTVYAPQYEPIAFMTGLNFREDNMVQYAAKFGSVVTRAHLSFGTGVFCPGPTAVASCGGSGETPGSFRANMGYGATVEYNDGKLGIGVGYDEYDPTAFVLGDTGIGRFRKAVIAAGYNFSPTLRVQAGYRYGQNKFSNDTVAFRDNFYWAGVNWTPVANVDLTLAYYYDDARTVTPAAAGPTSISRNPANPYQISFMAAYNFSKRTNVYLTTAWAKNSSLAMGGVASTAAPSTYTLAPGQDNQFGASIGMRHIF